MSKRDTNRVPIGFRISKDLLAVADAHAQVTNLDRYDVIRMATAKGLMAMRFEHELMMDTTGKYQAAVLDAFKGDPDALEHLQQAASGLITEGLERDVPGGPSNLESQQGKKEA